MYFQGALQRCNSLHQLRTKDFPIYKKGDFSLHIVKDVVVVFCEVFSIHPFVPSSVPSSIHGWHHTGKKTLAKIKYPPPPLSHVSLSRKGMPSPRGV